MKCVICGASIESVTEALELEWAPCFFEGDDLHGPACPDCCETLLLVSEDGDFELRDEFRGKIIYEEDFPEEDDDLEWEEFSLGFILN